MFIHFNSMIPILSVAHFKLSIIFNRQIKTNRSLNMALRSWAAPRVGNYAYGCSDIYLTVYCIIMVLRLISSLCMHPFVSLDCISWIIQDGRAGTRPVRGHLEVPNQEGVGQTKEGRTGMMSNKTEFLDKYR